jgi:hypothetical protein
MLCCILPIVYSIFHIHVLETGSNSIIRFKGRNNPTQLEQLETVSVMQIVNTSPSLLVANVCLLSNCKFHISPDEYTYDSKGKEKAVNGLNSGQIYTSFTTAAY